MRIRPCVSCGACSQACPTSAISDIFKSKSIEATKKTRTICTYCGVGCNLDVATKGNEILSIQAPFDAEVNQRAHLPQGPLRVQILQSSRPPAQAAHPLQRTLRRGHVGRGVRSHRREPDAHQSRARRRCGRAASRRRAARMRRITSCRNSFAWSFGTNNIDACARVCHSPDGLGHAEGVRHRRGDELSRRPAIHELHPGHRCEPDRRPSGDRREDQAARDERRAAHHHRSARDRDSCHLRSITSSSAPAPTSRCSTCSPTTSGSRTGGPRIHREALRELGRI